MANPKGYKVQPLCSFRIAGKVPELWHPETGRIETAAAFHERDGVTQIILTLEAFESAFVVFGSGKRPTDLIQSVSKDGEMLFSAQSLPRDIVITRATYGVKNDPQRTRDVTSLVQDLADRRERQFKVSRLADSGDPAHGTVKTLTIDFEVDGRKATVFGEDSDTIVLSRDAARVRIDKAVYGVLDDPARTRDVTAKLQKLVDHGEFEFRVARMAEGDDPAFMVVKTLIVDYTRDGEAFRITGIDPERLQLAPANPPDLHARPIMGQSQSSSVEVWSRGIYDISMASGERRTLDASSLPEPLPINGPWEVRFPPGLGVPEPIRLQRLISLGEHPDDSVKHFSGSAAYVSTFDVPKEILQDRYHLYLDLGEVNVMARVRLNGEDLGLLWKTPYYVEVSSKLKPADNRIEISVTNLWVNRLIGDEFLPEDSDRRENGTLKSWPEWLQDGKPSPTGRQTFTTWRLWSKDDSLPPSGLLGPVLLRPTVVVNGVE